MKKIPGYAFVLTLCIFIISACLPQNVQVPQSPLLKTLEHKSGLIAYIGVDGNIYVSDQGGGNIAKLTSDAVVAQSQSGEYHTYQLPTWSRDGNQLAFVGTNGTATTTESKMFVANIKTDKVNEIYSSKTELPFYLYWSPDGNNVSFLSSSISRQSMILQSAPVDGGERTIIDTGSPYYWSWSPNSHALITHSGGSSTSTTPDHIAFIQLQDSGIIEDGLDTIPGSFQAPAWSPDGSHILLTRLQDGNKEIVLTDKSGTYEKTLATIKLNTAFGWSSDSKHIAFIDSTQTLSAGTIGDLYVVDIDTDKKVSIGKDVVSFYWSPNGEKLAYYVPLLSGDSANNNNNGNNSSGSNSNTQKLLLQLNMLDIKTGKSRELFTYQPSDQFTNTLPYFDQYQQSATIWSPDNNNLVLSFIDSNAKPGIAVVAASGQLQPRILADGYLAFWSWK